MTNRSLLFVVALLLCSATSVQPPKLVVLIAVDGLRGDLLAKYRPAFKYGYKRMFDEGFEFRNAWKDHAVTVSHAGHVTLSTGNYPETHGIVDAAFYEKSGDSLAFTDGFEDPAYSIADSPDEESISTKKILTPGLAEWIRNANHPGKVLCVGTGNISSALYCSHPDENVFWYSADKGQYVTSTYFMNKLPDWVNDFNKNRMPEFFGNSKSWENLVPDQYLSLANKDDEPLEYFGGPHLFPYKASDHVIRENLLKYWVTYTADADHATLALAMQGIESLSIGKGTATDYVSIVLSQIDNLSHSTGPSSLETFNILLQQDIALGRFFNFLDEKVGKDAYVVALSSDHGFAEIPEQTQAKGKWAKRLKEDEVEKVMDEVKAIRKRYNDKDERIRAVKEFLLKQDFVADVYTPGQLNDPKQSGDQYLELFKRSHRSDRVPRLPYFSLKTAMSEVAKDGIMVRLKENAMLDFDVVIHGSAYDYDRFVPTIFFGAGVKHGSSDRKVRTIDVAPTLAKLAGVAETGETDGEPLF